MKERERAKERPDTDFRRGSEGGKDAAGGMSRESWGRAPLIILMQGVNVLSLRCSRTQHFLATRVTLVTGTA
ncbi:hypothetical protein E2C01_028241 [Portunus trituberculatus]|uniref:Uncharacterized protein n=1 Tax=Portunus trituberculatus TaxID=210409 RepID=A0A5B7END4_PORTR|nr:hypothetical protein [Portunus trituberculatus]